MAKIKTTPAEILAHRYESATLAEQCYIAKEPTGSTAIDLLEFLADRNLSAIQIKGCLRVAELFVDFKACLPKETR